MSVNVDGKLVENFTINEMANNKAVEQIKLVLTPAVTLHCLMMQELRKWYGKPMKVNSWYRTKKYNSSLKGADPHSCHLDGIATDIDFPVITELQIQHFIEKWKEICKKYGVIGGVSIEPGWLHFDSNNDPKRYGGNNPNFRVTDFRK